MNNKKNMSLVFLCAIFCFFTASVVWSFYPVYAYLPEYFGISLVQLSYGNSILAVMMVASGFVAAGIFKKFGSGTCMKVGSLLLIVYALLLAFVPNMGTYYVAYAIAGIWAAVGSFACIGDILYKEFGAESGKYLSVCLGANFIGNGVSQGLCGIIFEKFGIKEYYLYEVLVCAVLAAVCAFLIKNTKNETISVNSVDSNVATEKKAANIFNIRGALIFCVATIFSAGVIMAIASYSTAYFPAFGMSVSQAAAILSIGGLASGVFNLFICGKVIQKLSLKSFNVFICGCVILANVFVLLYSKMPQLWVIVLMILVYSAGATACNLYNILCPALFGDSSTEVMTKCTAFSGIGQIVFPIVLSSMAVNAGIPSLFILSIVAAAITLVFYSLSIGAREKAKNN